MGRSGTLRGAAVSVVGAAALVLGSGCGVLGGQSSQETVVIAADLELTGSASALGTIFHNALRLRVDQVNEQGLLGNRRLELVVTDNRSDPATAAVNLREFASDPNVTAIITGQCGECVVAAAETIESQRVPTISLAHTDDVVEPIEERHYIFKLGPDADHNSAEIARELQRSGVETIGLITSNDPYGQLGAERMQEAADRVGLDVVVSAQVDGEESSILSAAEQVAAYQPEPANLTGFPPPEQPEPGPDAVVLWVPPRVAGQVAVALRDSGYDKPLFLDAYAADELFLNGDGGRALDGARMIFTETLVIDNVIATSPAKAARQTWFNDYTALAGTYHAYSSFAADAVQIIVEAINQFDSTDRATVRDAIEGTQLDGLSGPIRIRVEDHSGLSPQALVVLVAQGDRWRPATT